ncbi:cysteine proteinase inhibitor 5-like [Argentina anserina]|uniref:cysteine proteinase inhibitor 5-like n=1 Tax=Argentina anserina TaxID=57926 RepID=UPI0021764814|nr:cysteine proteinase inhibitor 5-like [Potentilla anserina]
MRTSCFLALLALALILPLISAGEGIIPERESGTWTPLDPKDPLAIRVGKWAVSEYNKNTTYKLVFQNIVSGEDIYASGTIYILTLAAKNESLPSPAETYNTSVWAMWTKTKLYSFQKA